MLVHLQLTKKDVLFPSNEERTKVIHAQMASRLLQQISCNYITLSWKKAGHISINTLLLCSSPCSSILYFLQSSLFYTNLNS